MREINVLVKLPQTGAEPVSPDPVPTLENYGGL